MSDPTTAVLIPGSPGWLARGHVSAEDAIAQARRHYECEASRAAAALAALERGDVRIFHQRGIHRPRSRVEITPQKESQR